MEQYIHTKKNGVHIIDLTQTVPLLDVALARISKIVSGGGRVLFVGTKRQAQLPIKDAATRSSQYYINHRWLGGTLTNWKTVSNSINRLKSIEEKLEQGIEGLTKKERLGMEREHAKLLASLGGIRDMDGLPEILFVIDVKKESLAIAEANKLSIPIVAVVDTNCSPKGVDYIIPGNDDASRSVALYCDLVAQAAIVGIEQQMGKIGVGIGEIAEELGAAETTDESQVEGGEIDAVASAGAEGETDSKAAAPEQKSSSDDSEQLDTAADEADAAKSEKDASSDADGGKPESKDDQSESKAAAPEQKSPSDDSEQLETAADEADAAKSEKDASSDADGGKPESKDGQSESKAAAPEQKSPSDDSEQLETAADEADAAKSEGDASSDADGGKPESKDGQSESKAAAPEQKSPSDDSEQLETAADEADAAKSEEDASSDADGGKPESKDDQSEFESRRA